jgi:Flp pilus assembly pilin Flp
VRTIKEIAMLIVLIALPLIAVATRAGLALHRLWSTLPRSNRDFGLH